VVGRSRVLDGDAALDDPADTVEARVTKGGSLHLSRTVPVKFWP